MFSSEIRAKIQSQIEKAAKGEGWSEADKASAELIFFTKAYTRENGEARYWGFNGGGAASDKQKNFVRSLLRKHSGKSEAEILRSDLNALRESGGIISRQHISACIEILTSL